VLDPGVAKYLAIPVGAVGSRVGNGVVDRPAGADDDLGLRGELKMFRSPDVFIGEATATGGFSFS